MIPLWKASAIFLVWILLLGSSGMFVGNRYFWAGMEVRQTERAAAHYRQLVELEPDQPEHRVALGFNLHRLNDHQGAITQLKAAIDLDENFYDAYLNLGYVYTTLGYWDDALEAFEKCVEISPNDYKGYFNLGIVYRELEMYEAASDALNTALELRPGATDVLYHHALNAERQGDIEGALHYLERTLAFDPRYQDALDLYKKLTR
jgi:tetratricopeptide (TPR) repeat protein